MDISPKKYRSIHDGTSQSGRLLPALQPDYVRVDERSTQGLLAFAKKYARELKYFGSDNLDQNLDWSGFFEGNDGDEVDLQQAVNYLRQPESFSAQQASTYQRPHFVLLLVFLELLGDSRQQINKLTHRHLEFFYRDVLRMMRKQAVSDQVHVLVELEHGTDQQRLPLGTELVAGKDSLGQPLRYHTERELIANRIELAQLRTLYTQRKITDLRSACPPNLKTSATNRPQAFVAMLRIALGQPNPGDPLPLPIYAGAPVLDPQPSALNFEMLAQALDLLEVVDSELSMGSPSFDDFRSLMRLKDQRQKNNDEEWTKINAKLETAGKARTKNSAYTFTSITPNNFERNLRSVLGLKEKEFATLFNGLSEVTNIDEAYVAHHQREDVQIFIQQSLYLSLPDFETMMQVKTRMDNEWQEINRLLEAAGQRESDRPPQDDENQSELDDSRFKLPENVRTAQDFDAKLAAVAPNPNFMGQQNIDDYFQAFKAVEQYFYMSAEQFVYILSVVNDPITGDEAGQGDNEQQWNTVYDILTTAHQNMLYSRRRHHLKQIAQPDPTIAIDQPLQALINLLDVVLGEQLSDTVTDSVAGAIGKLDDHGISENDKAYLRTIVTAQEKPTAQELDWARIYRFLEVAQRNRENYQPPSPEKIEWRNLYPASDATAVAVVAEDDTVSRWNTFGEGEQRRAQQPVPPTNFGWAVASPLLVLTEGKRSVTLTLGFSAKAEHFDFSKILALVTSGTSTSKDDPNTASFNPFQLQLSTDEGWLQPQSVQLKWLGADMSYPESASVTTAAGDGEKEKEDPVALKALIFECILAEDDPALSPPLYEVHGMDAVAPVMRLMVKPVWDKAEACYLTRSYTLLRSLVLMRTHLEVVVSGLTNLTIANDQSNLDAKKPFEPFGFQPAAGSRFYVGHPEIVAKKLDSLSVTITWMGTPEDLAVHYNNYPGDLKKTSFKAKVYLSEGNALKEFTNELSLFSSESQLQLPEDQGNPHKANTHSTIVTEWNRYLLWELDSPDFQHGSYSTLALQKSLELSTAIAGGTELGKAESYQVNPPYTPKIKSLSLGYSAVAELDLNATITATVNTTETAEPAMRCFHIEPFGYAERVRQSTLSGYHFLPQYDFEGELYIGLRHVTAPQNLALLFQVAEGSANADLAPQALQWSYLSGNRWLSLQDDGSLLADSTRGLINSGIVELALKPVQPNTLLADDLYWLRVAIERAADSVCDIVAIHPNAVLATFVDKQNAADHLNTPLSPETISAPATAIPGIAHLKQPYTSFGGKAAEQDTRFYTRVSERLRHKQRALTPWDYERLVLEKFPRIYKAKCLRADPLSNPRDPGKIQLVVIPDIKNRLPFDPFEPKAPADQIRDIQAFLQDKVPPVVTVEVKNARYVPVKVRCGVRFMPGQDESFCRRELNRELKRFLSPWAYEDGADIVIGGSIYANSIIHFIDGRDYVDYLAGFTLFTGEHEQRVSATQDDKGYQVSASRPDEVLVAAHEHVFDVISTADFRVEDFSGIDHLKIELDFQVVDA
ncbi:MAG: hypothetical protein ACI9A2_003221 [Halioglobus sp.]|jgi:hypothetical protein